jgi:hypothetical protein
MMVVAAVGCGDDDGGGNERDGGPDGGPRAGHSGGGAGRDSGSEAGSGGGGTGGTSGSGGIAPPEPVMCGGQTCDAPMAVMGMSFAMPCCQEDDTCGLETLLAPGTCLPPASPGGVDSTCPTYDVMGFLTWYGCCTPEGQCGAIDGTGTLGCIPNSALMAPEQSCTYDASNTCTRIVEVNCDGNEDCPGSQKCCGQYDGGYRKLVCADDCAEEEAAQGGTWSNICHPGDTCETPDGGAAAFMCLQNTDFLPDFLSRCRDTGTPAEETGSTAAGEINCGDSVCGSGQKCCISVPGLAVCTPSNQDCGCTPEGGLDDGGAEDAGR